MHRPSAVRVLAAVGVLSGPLTTLPANAALAGQFTVATCQADQLNFSTAAFTDFATRGMKVRRACNPEGPGIRGLVTANSTADRTVPRGSVAMVAISAPAGTRFTTLRWAGTALRRDCRYALQLYADAPDIKPIPIKNVRANQNCPQTPRAQAAGYRSRTFNVAGATRIVQRVICEGGNGRRSCSGRDSNYIRTYEAEVGIVDQQAPAASIIGDTPLGGGDWVSGRQQLDYVASDNVGVRLVKALVSDDRGGSDQRPCLLATPGGAFANGVPCPNGPGRIDIDTSGFPEGTQQLVVQAQDTAGNLGTSDPVTVRIDRTPPARVDVSLEGGDGWVNQNAFTVNWANPPESDRAPITAANYKLCSASGGPCSQDEQHAADISRLGVQVPGPGEWTLSLWRGDAAGNEAEDAASVPVTLRYDPEPPQVAFEPLSTDDPTLVSAEVRDEVSGLAEGSIEISPVGSNAWQVLRAEKAGSRLLARIDDAAAPAGSYLVRAIVRDHAKNEASTTKRLDGQPMMVTLPLRIASTMRTGVLRERIVHRTVRRHGKRRQERRRAMVMRLVSGVAFGRRVQIAGRLANRDGQGITGAEIQVLSRSDTTPEQLVAVLRTNGAGRYRYTATGSSSRTLRFVYAGSAVILPAQREVRLVVPAVSSIRVSRTHVLNGQKVTFTGRVRTLPIPLVGKLIELQAWLSGRWETFRTTHADQSGRWSILYPFKRVRGLQSFRFRVLLKREAGYPFGQGISRSIRVTARGL